MVVEYASQLSGATHLITQHAEFVRLLQSALLNITKSCMLGTAGSPYVVYMSSLNALRQDFLCVSALCWHAVLSLQFCPQRRLHQCVILLLRCAS